MRLEFYEKRTDYLISKLDREIAQMKLEFNNIKDVKKEYVLIDQQVQDLKQDIQRKEEKKRFLNYGLEIWVT